MDKADIIVIIQDLDLYLKHFIYTDTGILLREKIRHLHKKLPNGMEKTIIRGALNRFKIWPKDKILIKLTTIITKLGQKYNISPAKAILESNRITNTCLLLKTLNNIQTGQQAIKDDIKTELK